MVAGATGAGKSDLAVEVASSAGGEIVNFDSIQVYRGFDIGSAKPSPELRRRVPHHLFDIIDATTDFNAADFARLARPLCDEITSRGRIPILTGGTFFYLRALLSGLPEMPGRDAALRLRLRRIAGRPRGPRWLHRWLTAVDRESAARIAPADRHRVERALEVWVSSGRPISEWQRPESEIPSLKIALTLERKTLVERLDARVGEMYRRGLVEETRALLERYPPTARPFTSIGYKEAAAVVAGSLDLAAAVAETRRRTRAYAKRQLTWLRSERNVQWVEATDRDVAIAAALRLTERFRVE